MTPVVTSDDVPLVQPVPTYIPGKPAPSGRKRNVSGARCPCRGWLESGQRFVVRLTALRRLAPDYKDSFTDRTFSGNDPVLRTVAHIVQTFVKPLSVTK